MVMFDKTPYHARPQKETEREAACMGQIFSQAAPVRFVYEAFGGVGLTARILRERFPHATIQSFDLDQKCCDLYNEALADSNTNCVCGDALAGLTDKALAPRLVPKSWGASLDFNRFTVLDLQRREGIWKRQLIDQVCLRKPAWVQITDSAVCYLHTNWKRYGLPEKNLAAYVRALSMGLLKSYGLKLVTYANHSRATYLLFKWEES